MIMSGACTMLVGTVMRLCLVSWVNVILNMYPSGDLDELDDPGSVVCRPYRHRHREYDIQRHQVEVIPESEM